MALAVKYGGKNKKKKSGQREDGQQDKEEDEGVSSATICYHLEKMEEKQ